MYLETENKQTEVILQSRINWNAPHLLTQGQGDRYFIQNERRLLQYLKQQDIDCTAIDFYKQN